MAGTPWNRPAHVAARRAFPVGMGRPPNRPLRAEDAALVAEVARPTRRAPNRLAPAATPRLSAPAVSESARRFQRPPLAQRPLAATAAAHGQLFFPVEPLDALMVHHVAVSAQQNVQATAAAPAPGTSADRARPCRPAWSTGSAPRFGPRQSPGSPPASLSRLWPLQRLGAEQK
jgi:hypothetical protein